MTAVDLARSLAKSAAEKFAKDNKLDSSVPPIVTTGSNMRRFTPTPTGIKPIDRLSGGGICTSDIWELYGDPGSGKSTTSAYMISEFNKQGKICILLHSEEIAMPEEAWALSGVDPEMVIAIRQHEFAENSFDVLREILIDKKTKYPLTQVGLIVIDSFSAMLPEKESRAYEKNGLGADTMMTQAMMAAKFFRQIKGSGLCNEAAILIINQQRTGLAGTYAIIKTSGGNSIEFYPKFRMRLKKLGSGTLRAPDGKTVIGHTVTAQVTKNNTGRGMPQGSELEFQVKYGKGVDEIGPIIKEATDYGVIFKKTKVTLVVRDVVDGKLVEVTELRGTPALNKWIEDNPEGVEKLDLLNQMIRAWMTDNPGVILEGGLQYLDGVEFDLLSAAVGAG